MSEVLSMAEVKELVRDSDRANENAVKLVQTLASSDEELRGWVCDALENVEVTRQVSSEIAELCGHAQEPVAGWACKLIARSNEHAHEHQVALTSTLSTHSSIGVQQQAALALRNAKPLNDAARTALQAAAQHTDPRLSRLANQALAAAEAAA